MFPSPARNTFRYTYSWCILSAVLFLPLLVWAAYDFNQTRRVNPVLAFFAVIFGLLFAYAWLWTKTRVALHEEGISYKSPFKERDLRWNEITETRYGQQPLNTAVHFGLLGVLIAAVARSNSEKMTRTFQLIGPQKITLTSNIRDLQDLMRLVLAAVNPKLREEAARLISSGGTASFGKISLSPGGVIWKSKEPIPYSAIAKCRIEGTMLRIKAEGKWLDNIAVTAKKVPNIFVLLDLIEERRSTVDQKNAAVMAGASASQYL